MNRCTRCGGSGFIISRNTTTNEDEAIPCECRIKREERNFIITGLISANIEPKYWEYSFENYLELSRTLPPSVRNFNKTAIEKLSTLLSNPKGFMSNQHISVLWIWGPDSISGHTSLAVILATELIKAHFKVKFVKMQTLINAFVDFEKKNAFFEDLNSGHAILLDNAFDPNRSIVRGEYTIIHLYNWLSDIISSNKKLICTSKIPISDIDKQFSQSRELLSTCSYELEFRGSFRLNKNELL